MDPREPKSDFPPEALPLTATAVSEASAGTKLRPPGAPPSYPFLTPQERADEIGRLGPYRVATLVALR